MKTVIGKSWRDAATLIVLGRRQAELRGRCNYDVLLQTRTQKASSFKNSVVFPGGVCESADARPDWLDLIRSFGFDHRDFDSLHKVGAPLPPLLRDDPVKKHISLRITAIRETFEELGLLLCSRTRKENQTNIWASPLSDFDVEYWQKQVSANPEELFNLCKQLECYPDVWSLSYWNTWLTPPRRTQRFDTAFFITALDNKPDNLRSNNEVAKVQWLSPSEVLEKDSNAVLIVPQSYELTRLSQWTDLEQLICKAKENSCNGGHLIYHAKIRAKDGLCYIFPGDELYPTILDYNKTTTIESDRTVLQLRESSQSVHRYEFTNSKIHFIRKNYKLNTLDMEDKVVEIHHLSH